jgi:hypothetical protein
MRNFLLSIFLLALTTGVAKADSSFTYTFTGTAPDGTAVAGTFNFTATPDGLGDGGYSVTGVTNSSLTLEGSTYAVSGITPLDGSPSPTWPGLDAYYITPGYHYFSYNDIIYPGTSDVDVLFTAGLGQPVGLFCDDDPSETCGLGVWVGPGSTLESLFPDGGNNPPDNGFEAYTITSSNVVATPPTTAPEPSSLFLLVMAMFGLVWLKLVGRH